MKEMLNLEAAIAVIEYLSRQENTIRQISKEIKINHTTVTRTVKRLADINAVSIKKIGPSYVVKLNKTPEVFGFLTLGNSFKLKNVDKIIEKTKEVYKNA